MTNRTHYKNKLAAFTILEVTIGMVITGILISTVYFSYNFLVKQSHSEMGIKNDLIKWVILRQRIVEDVYLSKEVDYVKDTLKIYHYQGGYTYYFMDEGTFIIEKEGGLRTRTEYENVSFNFNQSVSGYVEGVLSIQVREQAMQLYIGSYRDLSSRINDWLILNYLISHETE